MDFASAFTQYYGEFLIILLVVVTLLPIVGVVGVLISWKVSMIFSPRILQKSVKGKHCLVTGGSQGLGKGIALELVKAGAHVTIVARGRKNPATGNSSLELASEELAKHKVNPDQIVQHYAVDLTSYDCVVEMAESLATNGQSPEWVVCNAGSSISGFVANELPKKLSNGTYSKSAHECMIDQNYFSAVNVVHALIAVAQQSSKTTETSHLISGISIGQSMSLPSRIILVGSVLSTLSFIGYSAYSGSKYALRGFADALRSELKPLNIKVSVYFPGNMDTPGFEEENKVKPQITKEIEGASTLVQASSAAQSLLASILKDRYYISNDILGELARVSVHGGAPRPNLTIEVLASPLLAIVFSVWAIASDLEIKSYFLKTQKKSKLDSSHL